MSKEEKLTKEKLTEKKLTELDLDHIIYISVGPHLNEDLDSIIYRKNKETKEQNGFGKSLWAFNSGIADNVYKLCNEQFGEGESIYCVMRDSGKPTKSGGKKAKYYEGLDGEIIKIPEEMTVTFSNNGAYALLVEKYYKIIGENTIYTKEYDYEDSKKYIRGFGLLNKKYPHTRLRKPSKADLPKKISYVAKLKKPFLVKIFEEKPNKK